MALGWILPIPPLSGLRLPFCCWFTFSTWRSFGGVDVGRGSWVPGPPVGFGSYIFFRKSLNIEILDLCCCCWWNHGVEFSPAICTIYLKDLVDSKSQRDSGKTPHQQHIQHIQRTKKAWCLGPEAFFLSGKTLNSLTSRPALLLSSMGILRKPESK